MSREEPELEPELGAEVAEAGEEKDKMADRVKTAISDGRQNIGDSKKATSDEVVARIDDVDS